MYRAVCQNCAVTVGSLWKFRWSPCKTRRVWLPGILYRLRCFNFAKAEALYEAYIRDANFWKSKFVMIVHETLSPPHRHFHRTVYAAKCWIIEFNGHFFVVLTVPSPNKIGVGLLVLMWYIQTKIYCKRRRVTDQNLTTNMQELGTMQFSSVLNS